ncbi:alpha/beta fold hydrolase [uncultured Enterovirga sp.]|uniref:alpha/beta fold hydrolase n=1 Tax=uncultured Enterovirga sp. TaxID=2026352 RepID=UPI0035C95977
MGEILGRYVEVGGRRTYFESCGEGAPILAIHTAGREGRQWQGVMEHLAARYRVFVPDLPGHGKSWPLAGNRCLQDAHDIAGWLREFAEAAIGERFIVTGCSLGGNLSLLMAALFDEVRGVVALQGCDHTPSFTETALDIMTHPQVSLMHSNMDFSMSLVGSQSTTEGRDFSEWGVLSIVPLAQQGDLRAYGRCDIRSLMDKVRVPVLLAHGTEDWLASKEMVEAAQGRLVNAPLVCMNSLPGLGHFPHLEDPDRVSEVMLDFFEKAGL